MNTSGNKAIAEYLLSLKTGATFFEVGGCVRDSLLGVDSKDIDYTVVFPPSKKVLTPQQAFTKLEQALIQSGAKVFLSVPEMYTIRAQEPISKQVLDFVIARHELGYEKDSRKPKLTLGTLYDDLYRRDFTVNAIARHSFSGEIIDYFNGLQHLTLKELHTVKDPSLSFGEDPLRILRALRFSIVKGFSLSPQIKQSFRNIDLVEKLRVTVSDERIREELLKMFFHNTSETLDYLYSIHSINPHFKDVLFQNLWLMPTSKKKSGR